MNVAILGASNKPDRYSFMAFRLLREKGHTAFPVHPVIKELEGVSVYSSISKIPEPLDTVTVYLSQKKQQAAQSDLLSCNARRVIFNPGAENPELAARLRQNGVQTLEACTLVLLRTGQF